MELAFAFLAGFASTWAIAEQAIEAPRFKSSQPGAPGATSQELIASLWSPCNAGDLWKKPGLHPESADAWCDLPLRLQSERPANVAGGVFRRQL